MCKDCKRRTDKRYADRDALCKHYSIQGMASVERTGMCPFTLTLDAPKNKGRIGQQKGSWGENK